MAMQRQLRVMALDKPKANGTLLKVAFATSDLKRVDQHFGSAERFAIYQVEPRHATLLSVAEFGSLTQDGNEGKLLEKFVVLDGCQAVYCLAIGPSAVRQLLALGVQPVRVQSGTTVAHTLDDLQTQLRDGPTGWVARALQQKAKRPDRFDALADGGWDD